MSGLIYTGRGNNLAGVITAMPLLAGAYMVLNGQTTLGTLFGLIQLNNPVINMLFSLSGIISGIQGSLAAGDRLLAVLDADLEPERYPAPTGQPAATSAVPQPDQGVEFRQVQFSYSDGLPILQEVSFNIRAGQVAALVGPSGSGKSTVFRLLMGHYPVARGWVSVFGKPIHTYSLSELRDLFAFVPQDAYLYSGSVLENIRYGKPDASAEEITAAARASYAHDFILELPEGYHTLVGERGARSPEGSASASPSPAP